MAEKTKEYLQWYISDFQNFENNLNGGSKSLIHQIRKDAFNSFLDKGFPTTKIEEWKYTNLEQITKTNFKQSTEIKQLSEKDIKPFFIDSLDCFKFVFINGVINETLSDNFSDASDFEVENLKDYLSDKTNVKESLITKIADYNTDSLVALNTAFIQNGLALKINKNKDVEKPFFFLFISTEESEPVLNQPRILIDAAANSSATVIESFQSIGKDNNLYNVVAEIYLEENARLNHYKIQNQAESAYHISNLFSKLEKSSYLKTLNINLGGKLVRNNVYTKLAGEGCESVLNGIYAGEKDQHIDNRTVIEHIEPNCLSTEIFKGIMGDESRGVFNGKIHVYPDAQKTNAIQNNSGLLLSDKASIDTKPQLEIYADDVKCTHGATIGQLDEDALFYLRSRGIGMQMAKKMLVNAFAGEVIDEIQNEVIREYIQNHINEKLKHIE